MKALTLYEACKNYTEEQVNATLERLTEDERSLLKLKYGDDYKHPRPVQEYKNSIEYIMGKLLKMLKDPNYKPQKRNVKKLPRALITEDYTFQTLLAHMSIDELLTIISRIEVNARLSGKSESEILNIKREYLEIYKISISKQVSEYSDSLQEKEAKAKL